MNNDIEMTTMARHRKIRIIQRGLQLLQECKVPRFSAIDPAELRQQQYAWSERLVTLLDRLVLFLDLHRETLFEQVWGATTEQFRKRFALIYFEQISAHFERAEYQPDQFVVYEPEHHLEEFESEVWSILSSWGRRNWLFHHYGCVLGAEDWQNHPGEVYGFVRFLLELTREVEVPLDSKVLSFAETFGLKLLRERKNEAYQMLGIRLLNASLRYACRKNLGYTSNAEEILELALRWARKQLLTEEIDGDLFNIIYLAIRSVRVPNRSTDDEVMRTLVSLLVQDDSSSWIRRIYLQALIRILLLEVPEVLMIRWDCSTFKISGEITNGAKFRSHLLERYQLPLDERFSIRWKFRIGQMIPNLIERIVRFSDESYSYDCPDMRAVGVLAWLVMFPIGYTWSQKCSRLAMWCGMLEELFTGLTGLLQILRDRQDEHDGLGPNCVRSLQVLFQDVVELFRTIMDGAKLVIDECEAALSTSIISRQPCLDRHLTCFSVMVKSLNLRVIGVERMIHQLVFVCSQLNNV